MAKSQAVMLYQMITWGQAGYQMGSRGDGKKNFAIEQMRGPSIPHRGMFRITSYEWYTLALVNRTTRTVMVRRSPRNYSPSTGKQLRNVVNTLTQYGYVVTYVDVDVQAANFDDKLVLENQEGDQIDFISGMAVSE